MPPEPSAARVVESAADLLAVVQLDRIRFYEVSAVQDDEGEPREVSDEPVAVRTAFRGRPDGIDYRVELTLKRPRGEVCVDAAAMYSYQEPVTPSDQALLDFGDNVAMMTLFPYLREAMNDLSSRVEDPVVLPILPRGALSFRATEPQPETRAGDAKGVDA